MTTWLDDGVRVRLYVSTTGDFIQLGTRKLYPFQTGGTYGVPKNWTPAASGSNGIPAPWNEVNTTTAQGTYSISNANLATDHADIDFLIYRDFPVVAGNRYLIYFRARTMTDKEHILWYANVYNPANGSYLNYSYWYTSPDWEDIVIDSNPIPAGVTSMRVHIGVRSFAVAEGYSKGWGAQFRDLSIVTQAASYPEPTWREMVCDSYEVHTRYGRDKVGGRYDTGSFTVALRNDDGEYSYAGAYGWGLRPGRFIKGELVTPDAPSSPSALFYGVIDSLDEAFTLDGHSQAIINAIDTSSLLSNTTVPTAKTWVTRSGNRFDIILSAALWHPTMRWIEGGIFDMQAILDSGRSVRDELGLIADSEGGFFYADRNGQITFRDRGWPARAIEQTTVQADILAQPWNGEPLLPVDTYPDNASKAIICAFDLDTDWTRDRIINLLELANAGGSAVTFQDDASARQYGPYTYQRLDYVNDLAHPEYLDTRAADIMTGYTEPMLRVNSVSFRPKDAAAYKLAKKLFLNETVRVRYTHPTQGWGFSVVTHVQSVSHSFTLTDWVVALNLDQISNMNLWYGSTVGWDEGAWDTTAIWDG